MEIDNKIAESCSYLEKIGIDKLQFGVILGTGFGICIDSVVINRIIPYASIPNFPVSTVDGHEGNLVYGELKGIPVLMMQGRFHRYEGYTNDQIGFPIHVMQALGINRLIITNAAGGINPSYRVGDLMIVEDHVHLINGPYRYISPVSHFESCYSREMKADFLSISIHKNIRLQQGILSWMPGPSFETKAEISMLQKLGADAVTMSTIPEAITASRIGIEILGISCITNQCTGSEAGLIDTNEVLAAVKSSADEFSQLLTTYIYGHNN